jgi:hypothetical protein
LDIGGKYLGTSIGGIDAFAITKDLLRRQPMPNLLIGAPYWDHAVSQLYLNCANRFMKVGNQIEHVSHPISWDFDQLDLAGELNKKTLDIVNKNNSKGCFGGFSGKESVSNIILVELLDWQYPGLTEKQAMRNHDFLNEYRHDNFYFAFPWASLIDIVDYYKVDLNRIKMIVKDSIFKKTHQIPCRVHTVCQHIAWRMLLDFWREVGITDIHISHYESGVVDESEMRFHSWPLIAVNYEVPGRSDELFFKDVDEKKYLASFIGAHTKQYRSNARIRVKEVFEGRNDFFYSLSNRWFYGEKVYYNQIKGIKSDDLSIEHHKNNTLFYNHVLSDSIFSICPEGTGPNTIRLWESMAIGSIPVIISDSWIPPEVDGFNWEDFSLKIKLDSIGEIPRILDSMDKKKIRKMSQNCLNAYKRFANRRCF